MRSGPTAEEVILRHQGSIRGYLVYLGSPARLVDDLVQDTFVAALSSPFEDRGPDAMAGWLRTIARHLMLKALRRERRQPLMNDLDEADRAWVEFEGDDDGNGYLRALRDCLKGVGARASEVLSLRYRDRLRRAVIATRLELTEAGVNSILVRTRKRLRLCVETKVDRA